MIIFLEGSKPPPCCSVLVQLYQLGWRNASFFYQLRSWLGNGIQSIISSSLSLNIGRFLQVPKHTETSFIIHI